MLKKAVNVEINFAYLYTSSCPRLFCVIGGQTVSVLDGFVAYVFLRCRQLSYPLISGNDN